jgi:hypothetical protein
VRWGYVDEHGNTIIPFDDENANSFENGKVLVEKDGARFYINKSGK